MDLFFNQYYEKADISKSQAVKLQFNNIDLSAVFSYSKRTLSYREEKYGGNCK